MSNTINDNMLGSSYVLKNGASLVLRSPKPQDAEALIDYLKTVDGQTRFLAREPGEFSMTVEEERAFIKGLEDNPSTQMFLGQVDGEIVANCAIGIVNKYARFRHRASIGLAVKESHWRLGIGEILIKECIQWAKTKGVEQIELDVVDVNKRAQALYEKMGFEVLGRKKHAMKYEDGTYVDELFMVFFL